MMASSKLQRSQHLFNYSPLEKCLTLTNGAFSLIEKGARFPRTIKMVHIIVWRSSHCTTVINAFGTVVILSVSV